MQPALESSPLEVNAAHLDPRTLRSIMAVIDQPGQEVVEVDTNAAVPNITVLTAGGRRIAYHETADPMVSSRQTVARLAAQGAPRMLVVIGLGMGYLLDALEETALQTKVLALEPLPAVARAMLARRDWTGWLESGRLTLLVGPDYAGATQAWSLFESNSPPGVVMSPVIGREFPEAATKAKDIVRRILSGVDANKTARRKFAGPYLLNTLANLPAIASEGDARALTGAFADVPAVVVGAGPSLDRNLEFLSNIEHRVLLIAVDTALRPLLAAGIHPHLVVAVDPSDANARHLQDLGNTRGVWLVAEGSIDPDVLSSFAHRTFVFRVGNHQPWPWLTELGADRGQLRAWGSVLTTAFDLACVAGCDPVVFAGADLAYTDGVPYCRNTVYEPEWRHFKTIEDRERGFYEWLRERTHTTEADVSGGDVLTAPRFQQFRDWLVSQSLTGNRRFINATGAGILHGGRIVQSDLESLSLPEMETPPRATLATAWNRDIKDRTELRGRLLHELLGNTTSLPTADWLEFAGGTTSRSNIQRRVDTATSGLLRLRHKMHYLRHRRNYYNDRCNSLLQARRSIHAHYAWASQQTHAQQAHMLRDFIERTYQVSSRLTLRERLQAPVTPPAGGLRILDFGCGLGRAMEPLVAAGFRVDGVDLSDRMVTRARRNPLLTECKFFLSRGNDCGDAPDGVYDLIYAQLCFEHITPRSVRNEILDAWARALRPGGTILVQLPFFPNGTTNVIPPPHLPWSADGFEFGDGFDEAHVYPTPDELPLIYQDFSRQFSDLRLQVVDFPSRTQLECASYESWFSHLIVSGSTGFGLAERVYDPLDPPEPLAGS